MNDVGNPGPVLVQAQKCGRVKWVNGISTLPSLYGNTYINQESEMSPHENTKL